MVRSTTRDDESFEAHAAVYVDDPNAPSFGTVARAVAHEDDRFEPDARDVATAVGACLELADFGIDIFEDHDGIRVRVDDVTDYDRDGSIWVDPYVSDLVTHARDQFDGDVAFGTNDTDEMPHAKVGMVVVAEGVTRMSDLVCDVCGATASYADASIADSLRTCPGEDRDTTSTTRHTAVGAVQDGGRHDWVEA